MRGGQNRWEEKLLRNYKIVSSLLSDLQDLVDSFYYFILINFIFIYLFFGLHDVAFMILIPPLRIEPEAMSVKAQS